MSLDTTPSTSAAGHPRPALSLLDAIAMIIGIVVGAGIFETPSLVAQQSQSSSDVIFFWTAGGVISLLGALCYAELATSKPSVGGTYTYIKDAFGHHPAFLYAWARMSVIQTGSIALLAFVFGDHLSQLYSIGPYSNAIYAVGAVWVFTGLHIKGVNLGKNIQTCLSALQILGLIGLIFLGLTQTPSPVAVAPTAASASGSIGLALVFVLLTFGGWNEAAYISAEIRNKRKNIVRSLVVSIGLITALYLLLNLALLRTVGLEQMKSSPTIVTSFSQALLGRGGLYLTSLLVALCALTSINGTMFTGARSNFAVARDFPIFSFMSNWQGTAPARGYLIQAAICTFLIYVGTASRNGFKTMIDFTAPVFWFFFLLSTLSLFIFRQRSPASPDTFRVPFYPLVPLAFSLACVYLLYASLSYTGWGALFGLMIVAFGGLLLLFNDERHSPWPLKGPNP